MRTLAERNRLICLLFIAALLLNVRTAQACDACSSNMSSFYPGFADLGNSFVSFTSTVRTYGVYVPSGYRWMSSMNGHGGHVHPNFEKSAYYDQTHIFHELRFSYSIKKVTVGIAAPLVQKKLFRNGEEVENNVGMGDVRAMALFRALNKRSESGSVTNRIFAGGGFTIPTGESAEVGYDGSIEPSRQTGAGTFSVLFTAAYQLNVKKFGLNVQGVFQSYDADSKGYRFGNGFNCSARAYYDVKIDELVITPSVGINLEMAGEDKLKGENYWLDTGGKRLWAPVGLDVFYKWIGASFTWNLPVKEELRGLQFEGKRYFTAGLRYVFKKT